MKATVKLNQNALKRQRSDKKKQALNKLKMHTMKTFIKKAKASKTDKAIQIAQQYIDMNVKVGLVHKNKASRLKSAIHTLN